MGILPVFASSLLNLVEAAKKKAKAENKRLGFIMKALTIGCTLWNSHYDHKTTSSGTERIHCGMVSALAPSCLVETRNTLTSSFADDVIRKLLHLALQPAGQGRILEAGLLAKPGGGHPAAFKLGQDDASLFFGRTHPAFGVYSDRHTLHQGRADLPAGASELFVVVIALASSWSDGDSITGGAGAGANLLHNGEDITADDGTAEVDGRAAAAAQFRARAVKNINLGARD